MKVAIYDIEATSLNGSYGRLLSAGVKFIDEKKVRMVEALKMKDEKKAHITLGNWLEEANVIVGWNSKDYDFRFLQQRRAVLGLPPLRRGMHIDLMWIHKYHLRSAGHSLKRAGEDLGCKVSKYEVPVTRWAEAAEGDEEAAREIIVHCEKDVLLTEELYWKLIGFVKNIHA